MKQSWKTIISLLTGLPIHAFADLFTDKNGMNETDRQYVAHLHEMVENGEMTEQEALETLRKKSNYGKDDEYIQRLWNNGESSGDITLGDGSSSVIGSWLDKMPELMNSLIAYFGHNELTGAEREQNEFNAAEAQKTRDFTMYMQQNKYQMETQSMQQAGLNPAMVYGGGNTVPTAANSAAAHGSVGSGGDPAAALMALIRMPMEMKNLQAEIEGRRAEAEKAKAEAKAAADNADTNRMNAITNQFNAATHVSEVEVQIYEAYTRRMAAESGIELNDAQVAYLAKQEAYVEKVTDTVERNVAVLEKNADAAQKQAIAAITNANAAMKNAVTNEKTGAEQRKLMRTQAIFNYLSAKAKAEELSFLPAQLRAQVEEARARGYYFNEQGQLCDKQGHLVDAKTAHEYVSIATEVATTACQVAGTVATGGAGGVLVKPKSDANEWLPGVNTQAYGTYGSY